MRGRMTPEQALAQLLDGTGVHYQFTANRAAVIGPAGDAGASGSEEGATALKRIVVTGKTGRNANSGAGFQGTPDWVYDEPASVSVVSRDAVQSRAARNANDVLDSVAGVTSNRSEAQNPGIAINVRGLQDQNRVTTMIDGARQDFQRAGHGASQRVYVDTAFLRSVEVEKGAVAGVGGAGSLGGAVNFRTVTADDIIKPDRDRGVELNAETGTNAYYFNGSLIGAARFSEDFSVLGGVSRKQGRRLRLRPERQVPAARSCGHDRRRRFLPVLASRNLRHASESRGLAVGRFQLRPQLASQRLGGDTGRARLGDLRDDPQNYLNNTVSSSFEWDPDSELIDLKCRLWYNRVVNDELRDYTPEAPHHLCDDQLRREPRQYEPFRNGAGRPLAELRRRGLFRQRQDDHTASCR
ncbi:TonB-dependent receptor plug domain-containing protein [Sinorhizobium meliloti]|nr:TonB-dependent receptor plug domain-containing protein [Sinorhizobium meliloti]